MIFRKCPWYVFVLLGVLFLGWAHYSGKFHANLEVGSGRGEVWSKTIQLADKRPWLGWGIGSYKDIFPALNVTPQHYLQYRNAHNFILQLLFEVGYPITLMIVGGLIYFIIRLWKEELYINSAGVAMVFMDSMVHFPDRVTQCVPIIIALLAYSQFNMRRFS